VVETIDDDYVVVEKFGEAGKQAIRLDPRRTLRIV
jgi:phage repressor protein C with HTH and peptisase S24 domain